MPEKEKVIKGLEELEGFLFKEYTNIKAEESKIYYDRFKSLSDALAMLKEQGKKQITLQKKHVITWSRNDGFSMRKLYEAICETLLDEGELFIAQTDNHEKVEFEFYVAEGR